jgi:hypothetical protein
LARFDRLAAGRDGQDLRRATLQAKIGMLFMYDGRFPDASDWLDKAATENPEVPEDLQGI